MHRRAATLALVIAAAFLSASPVSAEGAQVLPAPDRGLSPGEVCFYAGPDYTGASWCYRPFGYTDVPQSVQRKASSFESNADVTVYAMHWVRPGECLYRTIWTGDRSTNWEWRGKLDAVQSERPSDCQPG